MDAAGLVGQARTLKVHPSLEALVLRGYLYRRKKLGTPKAPVAVLKNWAFATPRESHRGIHDVRFLQKKMGVNRGTHVPGPIYKLPSQAIRRRSGMAPRTANAARCGYGGMWGAAVGRTSIGTVLPDIRDGRGNRDRTALIPSVAWTSLVTNVVMTGLP